MGDIFVLLVVEFFWSAKDEAIASEILTTLVCDVLKLGFFQLVLHYKFGRIKYPIFSKHFPLKLYCQVFIVNTIVNKFN